MVTVKSWKLVEIQEYIAKLDLSDVQKIGAAFYIQKILEEYPYETTENVLQRFEKTFQKEHWSSVDECHQSPRNARRS